MTHQVAPGILTSGLGSNHTAMIIGSFRLGGFVVDLVDVGSGDMTPPNFGGGGRSPTQEPTKTEIIFTVTLPNGSRHRRRYLSPPHLTRIIIGAKFIEQSIRKIVIKMIFLWKHKT